MVDAKIDVKELQDKVNQEAAERFNSTEFYDQFISYTLDNFAYRYFSASPSPQTQKRNDLFYYVRQADIPLKEGLTSQSKAFKEGTKELAKRCSPRQGAALAYEISIELEHKNSDEQGSAKLRATRSWGHPDHDMKNNCDFKEYVFHYCDALELRNKLAFHLEGICEIF